MAKLHRIPNIENTEREASEWIARLNADDVSADDRACFESWRAAHPRHAQAYNALSATWRSLETCGPLVRAVTFGQAMNAATAPPASRRHWAVAATAASVALVGFCMAAYWSQLKHDNSFETAVGENAKISLPDGSSLDLNSNSLAKVNYAAGMRVIRLERGEAFFKVAHDKSRPFWVVAGNSWVRAVGTEFNVYRRASDVEVTVNEGTVKVLSQTGSLGPPTDNVLGSAAVSVVTAGEQIDVDGRSAVVRSLEPVRLKRAVAWREGSLYFENQSLGEVIDEMSRYTTLKIEIRDAALRQLTVGGTFRATPDGVEALLTMLQQGFRLSVTRRAGERVIVERMPES